MVAARDPARGDAVARVGSPHADRVHWLLPIDPLAHREGLPADWRERPDAGAVWDAIGVTTDLGRWCLRTGHRIIQPGDVIWAYLSRRQELCAVGAVRGIEEGDPSGSSGGQRHVLVDWDPVATAELGRRPVPRRGEGGFGQVPMSLCRANVAAAAILSDRFARITASNASA